MIWVGIVAGIVTAAGWLLLLVLVVGAVAGQRRLRALAWAGRLPWRLGALPAEDLPADEAPRGWKTAQLLLSPDGRQVRLAGITVGGSYLAEDVAVCIRGHDHDPPDLACACGFYAYAAREAAVDLLARRFGLGGTVIARALLEVDLSGIVIEHDHGYRAERQRVLGILLLPWCADCAGRGRLVRATALGTDGRPAMLASDWDPTSTALRDRLHPSQRLLQEWSAVRPLCAACADEARLTGHALPVAEVAARLTTEVGWLQANTIEPERVLASHRPPGHHR